MTFEEAHRHLKGIPHIGDEQAFELYRFIAREKPKVCLELGHAHGASSAYMAAALDDFGGHLDTVDLVSARDRVPNLEGLLAKMGLEARVAIHREINSYTWFLKKKIAAQSVGGLCEPCYDFCFIDGAKNWTMDGFAFFLVDKLLKPAGWILFDDYNFTYEKYMKRREVLDGISLRELGPDQRAGAQVEQIFNLLVRQHPSYSNFIVQNNSWAWAQKVPDGRKDVNTDRPFGFR
ncbi:MAG TPA: class I SAM-dependent methyltransferase [Aestuariivirgaceae bacterium]